MSSTVEVLHTDQDEHLELMGALALRSLFSKEDEAHSLMPNHTLLESSVTKNKRRMISVMDWIASAFAGNDLDDTVAAALSIEHRSRSFKLYLVSNRRCLHPRDMENGEKFVQALRDSLRSYREPKEEDQEVPSTLSAVGPLFAWALSVASHRIWRDFEAVDEMPSVDPKTPIPVEGQLDRILAECNDWEKEDEEFVEVVAEHYPEDTIPNASGPGSLLFLFRKFITFLRENKRDRGDGYAASGDEEDTEDRVNRVRKLCAIAHLLTRSYFLRTAESTEDDSDLEEEQQEWLSGLRIRLQRVANHLADIRTLVSRGFPIFERLVQREGRQAFLDTGHGFEIEWVRHQPGINPNNDGAVYYWPCSPEERFRELLSPLSTHCPVDELSFFKDAEFMESLGNAWKEGESFRPYLHCELRLIHHLEQNAISIYHNVIGVSKFICIACKKYFEEAKKSNPGSPVWVVSGTSNAYDCTWLMPDDSPVSKAVAKSIKEDLKSKLEFLVHRDWVNSDEYCRRMESFWRAWFDSVDSPK